MHNDYLDLHIIDVRDERDWNLFHLWGAQRIPTDELAGHRKTFSQLPENGVIVLVGNDEAAATEAWKRLMATASRPNAYILAGGINGWLADFGGPGRERRGHSETEVADDTLRSPPTLAIGSRHPAALPDPRLLEQRHFTERVRLQKRIVKKGGCG
jgi:rhodanese-related sulfurtransferase